MKEWKAEKKYDFHKIKELPIESILEDAIVMPKFDGETTFLFFDPKMVKWVTCNNWGHYRTDYRVTEEAEKSSLDKNSIYVGELIFGKNLYDFLRHKKDSEGLRLVLFEIFEDNPSQRIKRNFEQRLTSIPLPEIYLEENLIFKTDHLHLGKVPMYYYRKLHAELLQFLFRDITKTYEGMVVRGLNSEWVMKVKKKRTLDVIVMGMQKKGKSWEKGELGSFLVGLYHEGKLLKVGTVGFPRPKERKALFKVIMDNKTSEDKHYVYVSPKMVMEIIVYDFIDTTEYDSKKTFRSPIFQRWRPDKPSIDCELAHQMPEALSD
jgi:ATP-dependent DNA ligase